MPTRLAGGKWPGESSEGAAVKMGSRVAVGVTVPASVAEIGVTSGAASVAVKEAASVVTRVAAREAMKVAVKGQEWLRL